MIVSMKMQTSSLICLNNKVTSLRLRSIENVLNAQEASDPLEIDLSIT